MPANDSKIPVPLSIRIRHLLTQKLQGWLFLASVVAVGMLWFGHKPSVVLTGQVEIMHVIVPASRDGVLEATERQLARFDRVEMGITPIARIDVTDALLEMQSLTADRSRLQAELESERQRIERERIQWELQSDQQRRQLEQQAIDRQRIRLASRQRVDQLTSDVSDLDQRKSDLAIKSRENIASLREAQIAVQSLTDERDRIDQMVQQRLSPASRRSEIQSQLALRTEALNAANELDQLIKVQSTELQSQLLVAKERLVQAQQTLELILNATPPRITEASRLTQQDGRDSFDSDTLLQPYVQAITVHDAKIRELANRIATNQIFAPATGSIAEVHQVPGTFVQSGDPIMTIASDQRRWIVAYLDQRDHGFVRPSSPVEIRIRGAETYVTTSAVSELGNHYESVPEHLRTNANVIQWGVPIKIPLPEGVEIAPGQMVELSIH